MEIEKSCSVSSGLQWSEWQLLDSILPTGGFAHSLGLEAAFQSHFISGPEELHNFILQMLDNTGSSLLPYVYTAAESPDADTLGKLNKMLDATLSNEVARKASSSQGSALLRVAAAVFSEAAPSLKDMRRKSSSASASALSNFHHAPVFGLVCKLLGMDGTTAQRAYMFVTLRDAMSAATRLNLVGPLGAAVMQHRIAGVAEGIVMKWMGRGVEDSCQVTPLFDSLQGCHAYLFSRLFSS